jgi:EMC2 TPR-like repeat domain
MADAEAWHHLATLYIRMGDYTEAQFCYEELLMHQPQNPFLFCRYAEILYTAGGPGNLKLARQQFCYCLELGQQQRKPPLLRALYGLVMVRGGWFVCWFVVRFSLAHHTLVQACIHRVFHLFHFRVHHGMPCVCVFHCRPVRHRQHHRQHSQAAVCPPTEPLVTAFAVG